MKMRKHGGRIQEWRRKNRRIVKHSEKCGRRRATALSPNRRSWIGNLSEVVNALQAALQSFISGREKEGEEGEDDGFGGGEEYVI